MGSELASSGQTANVLTTKPSLLPCSEVLRCALETPRVYNSSTEAAFTSASIPGYTAVCTDGNLGEPLCMHENFPVTCFSLQLSRLSCIGCFQRPFKIFLNWFLEILDQLMYSSVLPILSDASINVVFVVCARPHVCTRVHLSGEDRRRHEVPWHWEFQAGGGLSPFRSLQCGSF